MIKKLKASKNETIKPLAPPPSPPSEKKSVVLYVLLLVIIIVTAAVLMVMNQFKSKPQTQARQENEKKEIVDKAMPLEKNDILALISRVSNLIQVNANEEPTVATVQDAESLRLSNPVFYKDTENGDRLLVWSDKAVLYSTKMNKLLAVMPIVGDTAKTLNVTASSTPQVPVVVATSTVQTENAIVDVRNGTSIVGRAKAMANLIIGTSIKTGTIGDAIRKDYEVTVIYKMTDKPMTATLKALAETTKGQVMQISEVEDVAYRGKGDIVIVVGKNFSQ